MKSHLASMVGLFLMTGMILPGAGPAGPSGDGAVPIYPLIAVDPPGFSSFSGILEMTPVSESLGVAFGGNKTSSGEVTSLSAFQVSKLGVATYGKLIGSGMGAVRAVSADWITYFGSGYGLVYVMFETVHAKPDWSALSLRVAKFNPAGRRTSAWREIWKTSTPKGTCLYGLDMSVRDNGGAIGVVFGFPIFNVDPFRVVKSYAYFIEADIKTGAPTGAPVSLPFANDGSLMACLVSPPAWNGSCWLVPASNVIYKSDGTTRHSAEALMFTVEDDALHTVSRISLESRKDSSLTYREKWIAPNPGSATDRWLFLKESKEIPRAQQRLDRYQYAFRLLRLDADGRPVQTKTPAFGKLAHKLAYDPDYEVYIESDGFSPIVASDASGKPKLFLSRLHSTTLRKKSDWATQRFERHYLFYEIDAVSGAVVCRNRAVYSADTAEYERRPIIFVFPGGPLAVINGLRDVSVLPYRSRSSLSVFSGLVE